MFFKINKVSFGGKKDSEFLAFKHYNPEEVVEGKKMKDWFRFSVAYWHTFNSGGADMFGSEAFVRPWFKNDPMDTAFAKVDALFEFCDKLGIEYFTFHDRDVAPEGRTLRETNKILVDLLPALKCEDSLCGMLAY